MCYTGKCPYENYRGDCDIKPDMSKKWTEYGYTACESEWATTGQTKDYYDMKEKIENELTHKEV